MLNRLMFGMALQDAPGEFEKFLRWTAQCEENDERRIAKIEEAMREDRREEKTTLGVLLGMIFESLGNILRVLEVS